jgi:PAS domain S-box-containing protein
MSRAIRTLLSSTQVKVSAVLFALTIALVGFLSVYFSGQQIASVRRGMENKATTYARLVSTQVESGVAFDDRETVREVFTATAEDSDVRALALYRSNGQLLDVVGEFAGRHVPPYVAVQGIQLSEGPTYIRSTAPVVAGEGQTGTLVLELRTNGIEVERARIERVALGVGFGAIVVGMLAAWWIARSLASRLSAIATAMQAVARGDLSQRPIQDPSGDEVGQLTRAFGVMVGKIKSLLDQIHEVSEKEKERLDVLVSERTIELKASLGQYKTLVESTNAIPWEMEPESLRFSYISPQLHRIFGDGAGDPAADSFVWGLVHRDDRVRLRAELRALADSGARELDVEYRIVTAEGKVFDVRAIVNSERGASGSVTALRGVTFDVTQQKKLEFELSQAQRLEAVGRLASGVAHEINTPVQFVSDSVHFVREAMADLATLIQKYRSTHEALAKGLAFEDAAAEIAVAEEGADLDYLLENIPSALVRSLEGLHRVATIVRSMKAFAHPNQTEMTSADLNEAVESTLTIARNEYKYVADIELDLGDIPLVVCHLGDVNQAILNIVVNAAHAIGDVVQETENKGVITVRTRREGDSVVISIRDTGAGIPDDIRGRIFDPFFTTKEVGRGTGQGLAIVRSVVCEKHRGEVWCDSEIGKGSTFFIRLPIEGRAPKAGAAAA